VGVKRPVREADHSPPSSADVTEFVELYLHSPNTPSWHGARLKKKAQYVEQHTPQILYSPFSMINVFTAAKERHVRTVFKK